MKDNFRAFIEDFNLLDLDPDKDIVQSLTKNPFQLEPGDIVSFDYIDEHGRSSVRRSIVAASYRGVRGKFRSTRGNMLLNCFDFIDLGMGSMYLVFKILYKNRIRCTYYTIPGRLKAFFGSGNFRTYNIKNISNLTELHIVRKI